MRDTLVRVQRLVDVNGETLDRIDRSDGRRLRDEVIEHFSDDAVDQTSASPRRRGRRGERRAARNVRRLNCMRFTAAMAAA